MSVKNKVAFALIRIFAVLLLSTVLVLLSGASPIQAVKTFFMVYLEQHTALQRCLYGRHL